MSSSQPPQSQPPQQPQQPQQPQSSPPNPAPSKTILGRLSQVAKQMTGVHFSQLRLNPEAKPPKLLSLLHGPAVHLFLQNVLHLQGC